MNFLIPKDPCLDQSFLVPHWWKSKPPVPIRGSQTFPVFWARNAIYHGLRLLGVKEGESVLVPAYHCAAAIEPIIQYGAQVIFYRIDRKGFPDFQDIERKIDSKTRAILAIHYFGIPQPIKTLQEFCRRHSLFLIEDCAHVLEGSLEGQQLGTFGDISVFSWRKFFPLFDGGHLVINSPTVTEQSFIHQPPILYQLKAGKNLIEKWIKDSKHPFAKKYLLLGILHSLLRFVRQKTSVGTAFPMVNVYGAEFDLNVINFSMSWPSQYILSHVSIDQVKKKRRENANLLLKGLKDISAIKIFGQDRINDCCLWVLPIYAPRNKFHLDLRKKGIPAVTWGEVIHPALSLSDFPDAAYLYQSLVFLPVHQSLTNSDVNLMIETIKTQC